MSESSVALLWDESFIWALLAYRGLCALGKDPCILTAKDVRAGALKRHGVLVVPGGWASDKTAALGQEGAAAIREFVHAGGGYLGLCGGAGLALDVKGGLALTRVSRVPTSHRVPSFSGEVLLKPEDPAHPVWNGLSGPVGLYAWWPGQFHIGGADGVKVVARYEGPGRDFCLADLPATDVEDYGDGWGRWEEAYGINLDPARLTGEPAVIETMFGQGRVFLSYLHLETPGCRKGDQVLTNVLDYLGVRLKRSRGGRCGRKQKTYPIHQDAAAASREMMHAARDFISFGERNFLWYWRNSWVLQWRRGIRGVEYSMLYGFIREVHANLKMLNECPDKRLSDKVLEVRNKVLPFLEDAKKLLMKERFALMNGSMSTIKIDDPEVEKMRERLFSGSKRLGGEYKAIMDMLDGIVLATLRL